MAAGGGGKAKGPSGKGPGPGGPAERQGGGAYGAGKTGASPGKSSSAPGHGGTGYSSVARDLQNRIQGKGGVSPMGKDPAQRPSDKTVDTGFSGFLDRALGYENIGQRRAAYERNPNRPGRGPVQVPNFPFADPFYGPVNFAAAAMPGGTALQAASMLAGGSLNSTPADMLGLNHGPQQGTTGVGSNADPSHQLGNSLNGLGNPGMSVSPVAPPAVTTPKPPTVAPPPVPSIPPLNTYTPYPGALPQAGQVTMPGIPPQPTSIATAGLPGPLASKKGTAISSGLQGGYFPPLSYML